MGLISAPVRTLFPEVAWVVHLEVVQHLLPGQQQQGLLPNLLGDLGVEEGVLTAAVGHSWGKVRESSEAGGPHLRGYQAMGPSASSQRPCVHYYVSPPPLSLPWTYKQPPDSFSQVLG